MPVPPGLSQGRNSSGESALATAVCAALAVQRDVDSGGQIVGSDLEGVSNLPPVPTSERGLVLGELGQNTLVGIILSEGQEKEEGQERRCIATSGASTTAALGGGGADMPQLVAEDATDMMVSA
jgi:hypothetical protein